MYQAFAAMPACLEYTGDPVNLSNIELDSGTTCEGRAVTRINMGPAVTIKSGATIIFKAPIVTMQNGFNAEEGAIVRILQ